MLLQYCHGCLASSVILGDFPTLCPCLFVDEIVSRDAKELHAAATRPAPPLVSSQSFVVARGTRPVAADDAHAPTRWEGFTWVLRPLVDAERNCSAVTPPGVDFSNTVPSLRKAARFPLSAKWKAWQLSWGLVTVTWRCLRSFFLFFFQDQLLFSKFVVFP